MTVDGVSHPLPSPFFVIATENTIEQEGTFPLPEAQLDRFLVRTSLGYPSLDEELEIVDAQLHGHRWGGCGRSSAGDLSAVIAAVEEIYIDPLLKRWALELVRETRSLELVDVGASVRGSLALERMARAWALVAGADVRRRGRHRGPLRTRDRAPADLSAEALMSSSEGEGAILGSVLAACLDRVPRPEPDWEAELAPGGP